MLVFPAISERRSDLFTGSKTKSKVDNIYSMKIDGSDFKLEPKKLFRFYIKDFISIQKRVFHYFFTCKMNLYWNEWLS